MVIPQLIINLSVVSLTTCNKLFEVLAPSDKVLPRLNVWARNQTTSWLFDSGAAITCMNSRSFNTAFTQQKPRKISDAQKGKKITHLVNVIKELNKNIISIEFMHLHKLTYDVRMRQMKFADTYPNTICATKQVTVPAMTSSMLSAKFNSEVQTNKTCIANIHCPSNHTISGMPAIISMDKNNNCKVMVENCAHYGVERYDLMGLIKIEDESLIPLTDDVISSVCTSIHYKLP
jgi:hypothetical protein